MRSWNVLNLAIPPQTTAWERLPVRLPSSPYSTKSHPFHLKFRFFSQFCDDLVPKSSSCFFSPLPPARQGLADVRSPARRPHREPPPWATPGLAGARSRLPCTRGMAQVKPQHIWSRKVFLGGLGAALVQLTRLFSAWGLWDVISSLGTVTHCWSTTQMQSQHNLFSCRCIIGYIHHTSCMHLEIVSLLLGKNIKINSGCRICSQTLDSLQGKVKIT